MNNLLVYILHVVFLLIYTFGGTLFIESAIQSFIHKRYFSFGINTMLTIYFILCLIRLMFGGL